MRSRALCLALLFSTVSLVAACGDGGSASDAGAADGGRDAGHATSDGGLDAAPMDAGPTDGGDVDAAGGTDAGDPDAGPWPRPGACDPALPAPTEGAQTARPKGSTCAALGYYEYVPPGYAARRDWPVIVEFHGDGQRGNGTTDLPSLLGDGLPALIESDHWDAGHRFVVISPQMDDRGGLPDRSGASVEAFLDFVIANYGIDVRRIYLTGYSGGAEPIYNYLGNVTDGGVVAAVLPISGWYSTQNRECQWTRVPIWYFHGATDGTVPAADHSTMSYDHLVACSPAPAVAPRYTMYAMRGHDDWQLTYDLSGMDATTYPVSTTPPGTTPYDVSIYDWFLGYSH